MMDDLTTVASNTLTALLRENAGAGRMHILLHLHLLTVSALLCRCEHFQTDKLLPFRRALDQLKKKDGTLLKQKAVKVLKKFYKYFKQPTKSTQPFASPDWAKMDWGTKASPKRNEIFKFTSLCQHVVNVYKLLSEVSPFCGCVCMCVSELRLISYSPVNIFDCSLR